VQDLRLPGMLHGRIVRPPCYGAKLKGFDIKAGTAAAGRDQSFLGMIAEREMLLRRTPQPADRAKLEDPGAKLEDQEAKLEEFDAARIKAMLGAGVIAVVRDGSFLGVIAEREEQAIKASLALADSARWTAGPPLPDHDHIYNHLLALPTEDKVVNEKQGALADDVKFIEATYRKPYMAHAAIGPSCAVAQLSDGKMTVWTHSQGVFPLRGNLAMALKMLPEKIHCIHAEGSGCYGHNAADDVALDAALLARAAPGRPVRVQWMRADEFLWEPFGPAMVMRVRAALSPSGRIADWNYELWSNTHSMRPSEPGGDNLLASWYLAEPQRPAPPRMIPLPAGGGDRNAVPLYDFPRQRVVNHFIKEMPLRVSALRTLGAYANVFATESFMDELALLAGADPVAFRLAHLKDARARAVIEAVAKKAGWNPRERGNGSKGRGIGFARYKTLATYVAVIADIEIDRASGRIAVPRIYAAADAGQIVNPDGLANQI
jgi:nicotinate dehydrogenase subunit B